MVHIKSILWRIYFFLYGVNGYYLFTFYVYTAPVAFEWPYSSHGRKYVLRRMRSVNVIIDTNTYLLLKVFFILPDINVFTKSLTEKSRLGFITLTKMNYLFYIDYSYCVRRRPFFQFME